MPVGAPAGVPAAPPVADDLSGAESSGRCLPGTEEFRLTARHSPAGRKVQGSGSRRQHYLRSSSVRLPKWGSDSHVGAWPSARGSEVASRCRSIRAASERFVSARDG